jgi:hypothetical protein
MNGLYEFAKYVDVLVIFLIFMSAGMYGIISVVVDSLYFLKRMTKKIFKI